MSVKITKDEVLEYRRVHDVSIVEARRLLLVDKHLEILETSDHHADLKNAVMFILESMRN